jgi:putative membrane protein
MSKRLHRAGIAIAAVSDLRGLLVPLLVAAFLSGGVDRAAQRAVMFGGIGLVLAVLVAWWRWRNTWYDVKDGAVRFQTGLLQTRLKTIPLDRLQSVDASQGPLQRLFGVQQLRLQAAGSGKESEIVLNALDARQVAELRAALARAPAAAEPLEEPAGRRRRLGMGALLVAGITSAQFGFLIPVAAAGAQSFDNIADPLFGRLRDNGPPHSVGPFLVAAAAVVAAAWLVAFAGTLVAFSGFSIERRGDRLLIARGLIVRRESSLPVARVQGVRLVDGLLRQPLGLTQVRVETAGYADERAYARTLFPLLRRRDVESFLTELLPELATTIDGSLRPPPRRALRRYLLPAALAALAVGLLPALLLGIAAWWPLPLATTALGALYGHARFNAAGWSYDPARIVVRERLIARQTVVARRSSVDIRTARQTPLQRRARLASVRFAIASKHRFGIDHVEVGDATTALAELATRPPARAAS